VGALRARVLSDAARRAQAAKVDPFDEILRPLVAPLRERIDDELHADPFQRDPATVAAVLPLLKLITGYFSCEVRGWENVPKRGPMLIVGNHSGGAETTDLAYLLVPWIEDRGADAPLYALTYDLTFTYPGLGPLVRKLGAIPANMANARAALESGAAVVVFPGGDFEVFRSWSERNRIEFGGHVGFVKLALATGVPVVPMTIHGAHQSTIVLTRGRRIARGTGLSRLHIKVFPFIWNIPFGVTPAFVPSIQLPAKVTVHFDEPLDWSRFGARGAARETVLHRCYEEITAVMQRRLDQLAGEHPYPVLTRLNELRPSQILLRAGRRLFDRATPAAAPRSSDATQPPPSTAPPRRRRAAKRAGRRAK
jgi:1-acyl-sn-glycerol-3-phosphate acyltransferase